MKRILPVLLVGLVSFTLIVSYLSLQNDRAADGKKAFQFTTFNRSDSAGANTILDFWKEDVRRSNAVTSLIKLDYIFMLVYLSFFLFIIYRLHANEKRRWMRAILKVGGVALLIGTAIDAVQDNKISHIIQFNESAVDMRGYTYSKFTFIGVAILSTLFVLIPRAPITFSSAKVSVKVFLEGARSLLSQFLKSIWIFFPGIIFLVLCIAALWLAGQGKDFIVAFANSKTDVINYDGVHWNYSRIVFFMAIGFWSYVSWYSSRIIYYIKEKKHEEPVAEISKAIGKSIPSQGKTYPNVYKSFLVEFPKTIGNTCFLVLELAILQSPLVVLAMQSKWAVLLLLELILAFYFLNKWIGNWMSKSPQNESAFRFLFNVLGVVFLVSLVVISFGQSVGFWSILLLIILLHIVYIFYTSLHRKNVSQVPAPPPAPAPVRISNTKRIMAYFCIPPLETGYYTWFLITSVMGIGCYLGIIWSLTFARVVGPFSSVLLAFGVLLIFGNFITALSVKYKLNFHFLLFLLASSIGMYENHCVRQKKLQDVNKVTIKKADRAEFKPYLLAWLQKNAPLNDSTSKIDMYFVMSNGGASRSGYWTASVLGRLEDLAVRSDGRRFSDQVFCLSGTSGGGVGVASYFSMLGNKGTITSRSRYEQSLQAYLKQDYFTYTFAYLLGPDYFHYIIPGLKLLTASDRGAKLEESFEASCQTDTPLYKIPFNENFSSFPALDKNGKIKYPILCINTTRVQDGNPGVVTNLRMDSATFNNRVDVVKLLDDTMDISMASGSILGARFPYLSPAGKIKDNYFVDGGYFDNSGAGVVQELIRAIIVTGEKASRNNEPIGKLIKRVRFHVIHIVNSPIEVDSTGIKSIPPFKNDLLAPVLTILGAYDMQTTVNDGRLINYLNDLRDYDSFPADYKRVSLYKSKDEWDNDKNLHRFYNAEPPYAMNWFMSDTTARRINIRLQENPNLNAIIREIKSNR
ncbi:hypothetical protein A4D02_26910 [Niastella koreensis]|uniref:PNPLA domain-containing protein n=2 Tax=Niastella koreensis TaxID=354356 RepID=G8TFN5_NIAKG|nr:patatin-like phospholipase family protein [Niastella koreensis]AEV99474.1 hypothetical protein Niako_3144 [Niastella koreensis GR20-10]OQP50069.1 hypothetical protein A4D02_26910 [Niastella koreensis]